MKIRPSDLLVKRENSSFCIYEDPFGSSFFYDKKQGTINKYPLEINDISYPVKGKVEAKKKIIELIENS